MIPLKNVQTIFLSSIMLLCLMASIFSLSIQNSKQGSVTQGVPPFGETSTNLHSASVEDSQSVVGLSQDNSTGDFNGGYHSIEVSSLSDAPSVIRHLMCKDATTVYFDGGHKDYIPIEPTTVFKPTDIKAEFVTTLPLNADEEVEWQWFYRNDSSGDWVNCNIPHDNSSYVASADDVFAIEGNFDIAGFWPSMYYPRAYRVDVYWMNSSFLFSEFFEVTNGGLDSPRMCKSIDVKEQPVNITSRFTIGSDTQAYHYLRFDDMAYFNDETGNSHNFTTVWVQPDGTTFKTHSCNFPDYEKSDPGSGCWKCGLILNDSISIDPSTAVGNWKVETYMDNYLNGTSMAYGPVAVTPFVVGNKSVADWTVMAYLDGDNSLENQSIDAFLEMANVTSSPKVNIVAQLDRFTGSCPPDVSQYGGNATLIGNWTGCKRFNIKQGMNPSSESAIQDIGEVDMGDPNTLRDFLNWTINNYPANSFLLVIWDHGFGCMGVCYDETSDNTLTLPALSDAMNGLPVIVDDLLMDACSMTMAEVAYQMKDLANILIGPEGLGYAPAPYNRYLAALTNDSSISPLDLAKEIVGNYINWSYEVPTYKIPSATMSAVDLTRITALAAAIDNLATTLDEEETLQHEHISLARNLTTSYEGPFEPLFGYIFDLYGFAEQIYNQVSDEKLQNASSQVMTVLSIGNAIIAESEKNYGGSHGLAIFFPSDKADYDYAGFANIYEATAFAKETSWIGFIKDHMSGYSLTIQTPYSNLSVKVDNDTYTTGDDKSIGLYLLPGYYSVSVPGDISITADSAAVFIQWNDGSNSNTRTFFLNRELTVEAEYQVQYRLIINADFGTTIPPAGEYWYPANLTVAINATPPSTVYGDQYERYVWVGWARAGLISNTDRTTSIIIDQPINESAVWTHEYYLTVMSQFGSPTQLSGWNEGGTIVSDSVISPVSETSGTRHLCTGWTGTGSVSPSGYSTITNFTLTEPSTIQWNWKTQYLLTVNTDPIGLYPPPDVLPAASWYDELTTVTCTAQQINGYTFQQWSSQAGSWDIGVNPINITMNEPYDVAAHYARSQSLWEILANPNIMQALLAVIGTTVTVGLVGGTWFRSRRRRDIVKAFLAEADDVYSRLKTEPKKCEEELYALRNTVLKGLTDGKITEDNYDIIDKRIDKYAAELSEAQRRKRKTPSKRDHP